MTTIRISVSGCGPIAEALRAAGPAAEERVKAVVEKTGHDVVASAQVICPVDTGALRSSISVDISGLSWEAGPSMNYAGYVEYGTSKMSPQPYMGPAFEKVSAEAVSAFTAVVGSIL